MGREVKDEQINLNDVDPTFLPLVEDSLTGGGRVIVGPIIRVRSDLHLYVPVDPDKGHRDGILELSDAQMRHLHKRFGEIIKERDGG